MPSYTHKMAIFSWPQILRRHFTLCIQSWQVKPADSGHLPTAAAAAASLVSARAAKVGGPASEQSERLRAMLASRAGEDGVETVSDGETTSSIPLRRGSSAERVFREPLDLCSTELNAPI